MSYLLWICVAGMLWVLLLDYQAYKASFLPFAVFASCDREFYGRHIIFDLVVIGFFVWWAYMEGHHLININ